MGRTYGKTKNCAGCRYWSEMIAQSIGQGVEALCLSDEGPFSGNYVSEWQKCQAWKSGHFGAVDDPPDYGEEVRAAYEAEKAALAAASEPQP